MSRSIFCLLTVLCLLVAFAAIAQQQITSVTFDEVPEGTEVAGGAPITLQGDTHVAGEISTITGIRFPDGTLQVTAGVGSAASNGLYSNRIPDVSPPHAYTEICFKGGAVESDIHDPGEPTTGGDCLPGDAGWIIERFERDGGASVTWVQARAACLLDGMRLPEPFEYRFTCDSAGLFAVTELTDDTEWFSNATIPITNGSTSGSGSAAGGDGGCGAGGWGWVTASNIATSTFGFRCAL